MKDRVYTFFSTQHASILFRVVCCLLLLFGVWGGGAAAAEAASLSVSPSTGVYTANGTFTVRVQVNTGGKPINAAEGTLSFNPNELSVVSVNRTSSIFNLWVTEPTFSNSAGTVTFSGGSPAGYSGQTGTIMSVTFRAAGAGTARVNFKNGSVLANDGKGTNILTAMNGGSFTIQAVSTDPVPEVIEYIAPANTPAAPSVTSVTHPDQTAWYQVSEATLRWELPAGVTGVRTLLDGSPSTIPTKVYDDPISSITLSDLDEGVSYFHVQFRNADGWGKVTHYRLGVDTKKPISILIDHPEGANLANPAQSLAVTVEDDTSPVTRFKIKVDAAEPFDYIREVATATVPLPSLEPGYHTVIIEAFDAAGNSIVGTHSFTIESFDRPVFTEYPSEINEEVIPVIKGTTRPHAMVEVTLTKVGSAPTAYTVDADAAGVFTFIPEGTFSTGVYELVARATDEFGAVSDPSDTIRIAVQQPGFIRIGSLLVSVLSVVIPLILLVLLLVLGLWYLVHYSRRFRRQVRVESSEALEILRREFTNLQVTLRTQETNLIESRRTKKLTKAESEMLAALDTALQISRYNVEKEIKDITDLTRKGDNA